MSTIINRLISVALALLLSATVWAGDGTRQSTIHLKSGEVVTGVITARDETTVEILVDGVKYVYTNDEVAYISHEFKKKNYDTAKFRGFIDLGYAFGLGEPRNDYWLVETSFGYQITPNYYIGAGVAMHNFHAKVNTYPLRLDKATPEHNDPNWQSPFIPLYAEGRYCWRSENGHTPWASLKLGANVINHTGFFASPSVGYHFATSQFFSFNIGVGYALHTAHYRLHCLGDTPGAVGDGVGGAYLNKGAAFHNVFIKAGVEF